MVLATNSRRVAVTNAGDMQTHQPLLRGTEGLVKTKVDENENTLRLDKKNININRIPILKYAVFSYLCG